MGSAFRAIGQSPYADRDGDRNLTRLRRRFPSAEGVWQSELRDAGPHCGPLLEPEYTLPCWLIRHRKRGAGDGESWRWTTRCGTIPRLLIILTISPYRVPRVWSTPPAHR